MSDHLVQIGHAKGEPIEEWMERWWRANGPVVTQSGEPRMGPGSPMGKAQRHAFRCQA